MIKTKLCGFTNQKTVDLAVSLGVNFIGFVFYKNSPRDIPIKEAGLISQNIPSTVKKVAVIKDLPDLEIQEIIQYLKPDFIQIHNSDMNRILEIKNQFKIPIIKAFSIDTKSNLKLNNIKQLDCLNPSHSISDGNCHNKLKNPIHIKDYEEIADLFLFDNKDSGSGKNFDWNILENLKTEKAWFLSGGLNIDNIDLALEKTGAKMIDLSSGIEETKGIKSEQMIRDFMKKIDEINKR